MCLILTAPVSLLLHRLQRDPMAGATLCFRRGLWTLQRNGEKRVITPAGRCVITRWVIYLAFTESSPGARHHGWLYVDAVPAQQWRRLRVRLSLRR